MLSKHRSRDLHVSAQAPYNGGLCGTLISRATTTTGTKETKETMDPAPGSMPFHANFTVSPRLDRGWPNGELISRAAITIRTKKSEEIMDPSLGNMLSHADLNAFPRLDQVGPVQELVPRRPLSASEASSRMASTRAHIRGNNSSTTKRIQGVLDPALWDMPRHTSLCFRGPIEDRQCGSSYPRQ